MFPFQMSFDEKKSLSEKRTNVHSQQILKQSQKYDESSLFFS